jgi:hypothetical protein
MRKRQLLTILPLLLLISCSSAFWQGFAEGLNNYNQTSQGESVAQENVCVKYKTTKGWSKGYSVNAYIIKGSELNEKTGTYQYNYFSTYVVIFWAKGQASILELDSYFGSISYFGHYATDQRGRQWQISKTTYCY